MRPNVLEHPVPSRPEPEKEEPERLEPASKESELEVPLGPEARRRVQPDDGGHVPGCQCLPVRFGLCVHPRLQGLELNRCCRTLDDALCDPRHAYEEQKGEDQQPPIPNAIEKDEGNAERGIDGENVTAVEEAVQPANREEDEKPPDEAGAEVGPGRSTVRALHLQREAQTEHEREDAEPFAAYKIHDKASSTPSAMPWML